MPETREIAKIESTHIGIEDHGLFTVNVNFSGGSWGQGTGHIMLGEEAELLGRFVQGFIKAVGVDSWEGLKGRTVFVLRDGDSLASRIVGIENLPTERGGRFEFADVFSAIPRPA